MIIAIAYIAFTLIAGILIALPPALAMGRERRDDGRATRS